ncbi:MAG: hypothetical protein AB1521_17090 [Bacteroidota bacterium]
MKKTFFVLLIILLTGSINYISAQDSGFGAGIILGEPTGLSAKYWLDEDNALDFGLAYSFIRKNSAFSIHADYLYHAFDLIESKLRIPVYYGFGARIRIIQNEDTGLGARGVIGVAWLNDDVPIDVFIEVVPVFNLFPATSLNLDAAIGVRYFFK